MHFSITTFLALALGLTRPVLTAPGISPASVSRKADPETSFQIIKTVVTPPIPPKPDVVLLVDVTGSMVGTINNIKSSLSTIIDTVLASQRAAQFSIASFGDLRDPNGFQVNQGLTSSRTELQKAVDSLRAEHGLDEDEDWIYALQKIATGAVSFRPGSSRIVVLVGDAPSHDPSGRPPPSTDSATLSSAIAALKASAIRVIAVNVNALDARKQASAVTSATGGVILGASANEVSAAIVKGLHNLDVTVVPSILSCSSGLSLSFNPPSVTVLSGSTISFQETASVAKLAAQGTTLSCKVQFLLNGAPGGDAFIQTVSVPVNILGCDLCDPDPRKNKCHITTTCTGTPYGTMCLTRPGFKADGVKDDENRKQWRLKWNVGGHEHRVAVKPGLSADTVCSKDFVGKDVCKEVVLGSCIKKESMGWGWGGEGQEVLGGGDL